MASERNFPTFTQGGGLAAVPQNIQDALRRLLCPVCVARRFVFNSLQVRSRTKTLPYDPHLLYQLGGLVFEELALQSSPLIRSAFCLMKIDHTSGLTRLYIRVTTGYKSSTELV